jgi:F0F1-type ATP synthase assembly protein I
MKDAPKTPANDPLRALALVGHLGWVLAAPVLLGAIVGNLVDRWLNGRGLIFLGVILVCIAMGIVNAVRLLKRVIDWK